AGEDLVGALEDADAPVRRGNRRGREPGGPRGREGLGPGGGRPREKGGDHDPAEYRQRGEGLDDPAHAGRVGKPLSPRQGSKSTNSLNTIRVKDARPGGALLFSSGACPAFGPIPVERSGERRTPHGAPSGTHGRSARENGGRPPCRRGSPRGTPPGGSARASTR